MNIIEARKLIAEVQYPLAYDKEEWLRYPSANCYPYALGMKTNEPFLLGDIIGRRVTERSTDLEKIVVFRKEMEALGFYVQECDTYDIDDEGFKIYLQVNDATGEYHFLRCDEDGLWSHKASDFSPNRRDSAGYEIEDPEAMAEPGFHGWCFMLYREY